MIDGIKSYENCSGLNFCLRIEMDYPIFTFPSKSLQTFGLNSSAYLKDGNVIQQVSCLPRFQISSWRQLSPRVRIVDCPIPDKQTDTCIETIANYYHANYMQELVPFALLKDLLHNDQLQQRSIRSYDPFVGNSLYAHEMDNGSLILIYASGEAMNHLKLSYAEDGIFDPAVGQTVEFNTPIRQVCGIAARQHLMAVRTWDGVTFLELEMDNFSINLNLIESHQFAHSPLHVEWHQVLFGQALISLEGGLCYIWDLKFDSGKRLECIYNQYSRAQSLAMSWNSCVFGSHPKVVIRAGPHHLELLDPRSGESPSRILTLQETRLYSIAKDPLNCFHLALGKTKTTDLIDLRNVKSPFFQMAFQDERDIFSSLKFIHAGNRYLYGWGSLRGNCMLYELDSPEKSGFFPPCIRSVQNLTPLTNFFAKDTLPFLPERSDHHSSLRQDEKYPYWPNLIGSAPIFSGDHFKLYNQYEDGSIYFGSSQPLNIKINHDYIKSEEDCFFKQHIETQDFFQNTQFLKDESKNPSKVVSRDSSKSVIFSPTPTATNADELSPIQDYYLTRWIEYDKFYPWNEKFQKSKKSLKERKRALSASSASASASESDNPTFRNTVTIDKAGDPSSSRQETTVFESQFAIESRRAKKVSKDKRPQRKKGF